MSFRDRVRSCVRCVETAEHAAVATVARDPVRGSAFGLLAAVQSFGNLAASAAAGLLYTVASPTVAFADAATLTAASLVAPLRGPLTHSGSGVRLVTAGSHTVRASCRTA
jgi:hypothetical protein